MNSIEFRDMVKLIHPDINPNIKDAGMKMTEVIKNKKNPEILYELGVRWGVIKKTVKEIIMLVVGDMVSFKRPTTVGVEFGTIVDIKFCDNYETWTKNYSVKIYTTDGRCLNVALKTLESEKQGVKFVRKVDSFTVASHLRSFNEKSKPASPYRSGNPYESHAGYAYGEPAREDAPRTRTSSWRTPASEKVVLEPNTIYRHDNINIFTKYGNKKATRTTEKRVYFVHNGKETWKNFNASTYAWRE